MNILTIHTFIIVTIAAISLLELLQIDNILTTSIFIIVTLVTNPILVSLLLIFLL